MNDFFSLSQVYQNKFPYIHMEPPGETFFILFIPSIAAEHVTVTVCCVCVFFNKTDVIYERWAKIKPEVKKQVGHMMHISVFWRYILLRPQDNHPTTFWAVDMGFLDSKLGSV